MARPARHFSHAARLKVDRLETAAPDAPPGWSAGVESKTSGTGASPWQPLLGIHAATVLCSGPGRGPEPVGGLLEQWVAARAAAPKGSRHLCPAAAKGTVALCCGSPNLTLTPKALHVCPMLRHGAKKLTSVISCCERNSLKSSPPSFWLRLLSAWLGRGLGVGVEPGVAGAGSAWYRLWPGLAAAPQPPIRP